MAKTTPTHSDRISTGKSADKQDEKSSGTDTNESAVATGTRFEDALGELETIVTTLETGEQSLAQSLAQFERGISLARYCQHSLGAAERKISILMADDSGEATSTQEFDVPEPPV